MKTPKKSSISFQIIIGYIVVALLGIIMMGCSLYYLFNMQREIVKIEKDIIEPVTIVAEQVQLIESAETDLYKMIIGSSDERILYYELFKEKDKGVKEAIAIYEKSELAGTQDESLWLFKEKYHEYRSTLERIYHLSIANDLDQAKVILMDGNFKEVKEDMTSYLQTFFSDKQVEADILMNEQASRGDSLRKIISILAVIWLGIVAVIPTYIGKKIGRALNQIKSIMEQVASGDLTTYEEIETSSREIDALQKALEIMCIKMENVFQEVKSATYQVSEGAEQISGASTMLATGATEQAGAIEEMNAAMEEIAAHTKETDKSIRQIHQLSVAMSERAQQGNSKMQETLAAMTQVDAASSEISKINKVIEEIAFQTNMLALNAAVEAARAGQHGLGFAVVAEEVRKLAAKSANASKETHKIIEESLSKLEQGITLLRETAEVFGHITKSTQKENGLINNIMEEVGDEADRIVAVSYTTEQVSEIVQSNSAAAQETAAASIELARQAERLKVKLSQFKLKGE